ncbi:MAG: hypothetical protein SV775_06555 [Thermodesulfobacteriota bacterium]|nr:hypothetical protein [Thermodesulfobacteriota bacterium]
MRKRLFLITTIVSVGFAMLLANAGGVYSQEAAIVKVWAKNQTINIDPSLLEAKKNTIVLWMNGIFNEEIQIVFEDGRKCMDVTVNPDLKHPGFFMDAKNCFVTSFIRYTDTSSLQFPEPGNFEYTVLTMDGKMKGKGRIVVR